MKNPREELSEIYNFRAVDDRLLTAGQPTEGQLHALRAAGVDVVINLALPTSDNALANEGSIVTGLSMAYAHVPVEFQAPKAADFQAFCGLMTTFKGRNIFVHCAANMRVSAFVFLYRVKHQGVPIADAEREMLSIWRPDGVWASFIADTLDA